MKQIGGERVHRRGTTFDTATPLYAIKSFVERLGEPGRDRGRRYPRKLDDAWAGFREAPSGATLRRVLTLAPSALMEPCECLDPIHVELFVQLGRHREELLFAQSTAERRAAREWLSSVLFGGSSAVLRPYDEDLVVDAFYTQDALAWSSLLQHRPGLIHPPQSADSCESVRCLLQGLVRLYVAFHMTRMQSIPSAGLRRDSRIELTNAFLKMPGGWALAAYEPEDIGAVYRACLDWIVHLDIAPENTDKAPGDDTLEPWLSRSDVDHGHSLLPEAVWRDVLKEDPKTAALEMAGFFLGCSAEKVRRGMFRPRADGDADHRPFTR